MSDPCASRHALALAYHVHDLAVACPNGHAEAGEPCPDERETLPESAPWFILSGGDETTDDRATVLPEVPVSADTLAQWAEVLGP